MRMNSCIPGKKKKMQCFDLEGKNGVGKNKTLLLWAAIKTKHLLKTSAHFPVKRYREGCYILALPLLTLESNLTLF